MAVAMILYFFDRVADNGLNLLEDFGSKKFGRVISKRGENKGPGDVRIVIGAVKC